MALLLFPAASPICPCFYSPAVTLAESCCCYSVAIWMPIKKVSVFNFGDIFLKPDGPKKEKEANEMINKQWKKRQTNN